MTELLEHAARTLGGPDRRLALVDPETIPSPHRLVRCRVIGANGPTRVVVKQVTTAEFTSENAEGSSHRLLNEWAALRFLNDRCVGGPWPRLLGGSMEASLVILEDLGEHPTVLDILLANRQESPTPALQAMGSTLGQLHSETRTHVDQFRETQSVLGVESPRSDSTVRLAHARPVIEHSLQALGVEPHHRFWDEVSALDDAIHNPAPLHTLIHADAGPQNFLWNGDRTLLIDYEFATVGYCLLDVVSARLGFPHSSDAQLVPLNAVEALEDAYRDVAMSAFPEFEDDAAFLRHVIDACAHWALIRWAGLWQRLFSNPDDVSDMATPKMRSQAFTVFRRFTATAEGVGHRLPILTTTENFTRSLQHRFPGLGEEPPYPAFRPN